MCNRDTYEIGMELVALEFIWKKNAKEKERQLLVEFYNKTKRIKRIGR